MGYKIPNLALCKIVLLAIYLFTFYIHKKDSEDKWGVEVCACTSKKGCYKLLALLFFTF